MSHPETLPDFPNAISSPASAAGHLHCVSQASPTPSLSGLEAALASLSPRRAKELGLLTSGTYGPISTTSSASAVLQSSLESRLQAVLSTLGSTLYKLTWKAWDTPSRRSRFRLRASVPRTSETVRTGWVTPTSRDWKDSGADIKPRSDGSERLDQLPRQANLTGWPTPMAGDGPKGGPGQNGAYLTPTAHLAGWPTPMAGTPAQNGNNAAGNNDSSRKTVDVVSWNLAGWPTPRAADGLKGTDPTADTLRGTDLPTMASWSVTDGPARLTATGQMLTGSSAGMESGGQLNPAHSLWLMGYPAAWLSCGVRAMQSMSTQRKRSSKRTTGAAE
jgi:hypothetical protein